MRLLGRLLLVLPLTLLVAIPFGALALGLGALLEPTARELVGSLSEAGLRGVVADLAEGVPPDEGALTTLAWLWGALMVVIAAPPAFAAVTGEVLGFRSAAWYGGAAGLAAALIPWSVRGQASLTLGASPAEARLTALLFLSGAASGLIYWVIAGRGAGKSAGPAPSQVS